MKIKEHFSNSIKIAEADSAPSEIIISDVQTALDFAMTLDNQHQTSRIILRKEAIAEDFFDLRSGIAGAILQKYMNYQIRLAIVGDFSQYASKALKDFIYESNQGNSFFFVATVAEAVRMLSQLT